MYVSFPNPLKNVTKHVLSITHAFLLIHLNFIYTKMYVGHQGLFLTYLYVYVCAIISKDNSSKFLKSTNPHS